MLTVQVIIICLCSVLKGVDLPKWTQMIIIHFNFGNPWWSVWVPIVPNYIVGLPLLMKPMTAPKRMQGERPE